MDIEWTWTPKRKGTDLFDVDMTVFVDFDTNESFFIEDICIAGICLDKKDDLFTAIRRDLDNDDRFNDYVWERKSTLGPFCDEDYFPERAIR